MIIQPTGDKRGHYGIFVTKLAQALIGIGRSVVLVTNAVDAGQYGGLPPGVEVVRVGVGRLAFIERDMRGAVPRWRYWYQYYRNSLLVTAAALRLARRRGITDIYASDTEFLVASFLLLLISHTGRRVLIQVNAANFSYSAYRGGRLKKLYKLLQSKVFRLALLSRIVGINALGEWHAARLREQLQLPDDFPILVVPDGADLSDQPQDRTEARRALQLKQDDVLLLLFGNFRRDKDYATFFRALAAVGDERLKVMLVGHLAEWTQEELEALIRAHGVGPRVALRYFDFASPDLVRSVFSACDVLVLPYRADYVDGSGPLRKEAATYARGVVGSDVAEMGQLIRSHSLGAVFAPGDADSLSVALRTVMSIGAEQRDQWGRNCRQLGASNSWSAMAERFAAFLSGTGKQNL